jgi:membrane protein DedA with SNARE-associated domain
VSDATSVSDLALAALITYGPLALALTLLLGATGVPFPGAILLMAAGAFARQSFIDWRFAWAAAILGVVLGDTVAYGIGRMGGVWAERRLARMGVWQKATDEFSRRGGWAIFLTRFLITPLGVAVSLIAGISAYPFQRFVLIDLSGELLWVSIYGGIGFALGSQWQAASQFVSDFSGLILGVVLLIVGIALAFRFLWRRGGTNSGAGDGAGSGVVAGQPASAPQPGD